MISQLMKSDRVFLCESGVLDKAQWYKPGSFPIAAAAQRSQIQVLHNIRKQSRSTEKRLKTFSSRW